MDQKKTGLAARAYDRVEEAIVTLELPPGTVFSEIELSERIGIGRTPLREALQRLAQDGLIRVMPRRGMVVTEVNITEYLTVLETRRVLDRLIASKAARRAQPQQRAELETCAREIDAAAQEDDLARFMRLDRRGDALLAQASRNAFAARAVRSLHAHCRRFWYVYRHDGDLGHTAALHAGILRAVAEGNQTAAAVHSDKLIDYLEKFARDALELR